jgi:translocon-associated protein subunit gamma
MSGSKALSNEEELLLQDNSRKVSTKSSILFYGNAAIISAIPTWVFWRIHQMEPVDFYVYYIIASLVAAYLVCFAYKNVKFVLKHKIAQKREDAISKEVSAKLDKKNVNKKEKDDRILWKKNEVADYEATTFSIFYNNTLFLVILFFFSFFVFRNFAPVLNYLISMATAAGLLALFSTGTK